MSPFDPVDEKPAWPTLDLAKVSAWIGRALSTELVPELTKIQERQELFLRRELSRIDEYFENYARELSETAGPATQRGINQAPHGSPGGYSRRTPPSTHRSDRAAHDSSALSRGCLANSG
jgi:hypothetical protein